MHHVLTTAQGFVTYTKLDEKRKLLTVEARWRLVFIHAASNRVFCDAGLYLVILALSVIFPIDIHRLQNPVAYNK